MGSIWWFHIASFIYLYYLIKWFDHDFGYYLIQSQQQGEFSKLNDFIKIKKRAILRIERMKWLKQKNDLDSSIIYFNPNFLSFESK